jgi:diguanylate cyclase
VTEGPDRRAPTESALTLGVLDAQALRVRSELAALSTTLAAVQQELGDDRIARLLAANEQLVRAALLADSIAEKALMSLADLTHDRPAAERVDVAAVPQHVRQLDAALAMARRRQTRLAVIALGLEACSDADGRPGRAAGAPVLQAAARRLEAALRRADTVSLLDGDPALLLLVEVARAGDAALVATKAVALLAAPVCVDGRDLRLLASVGIAVYPGDGAGALPLLELAQAALQRAAQRPPGGIEFAGVNPDLPDAPEATSGLPPSALLRPDPPLQNLRDVNERLVVAAVQAQQQQGDLQDKTRELQVRFLAMVAHELRNPLMPIRTAAELLLRARGDETMLQRLQGVIQRQVAQMSRLVDDLLDTSRITSGRFRLERTTIDLEAVLGSARDACQPAIESRLQNLEWAVAPGPILIEGDAVRLAQVFSNLLDNASKYTPRGGRVRVASATRGGHVEIEVSDEGRGISAAAMPHIFDLFAQDPRTLAFGNGGLGIGLAVVRELVDAHGGSIVARSDGIDRGSAFLVSLPGAVPAAVV